MWDQKIELKLWHERKGQRVYVSSFIRLRVCFDPHAALILKLTCQKYLGKNKIPFYEKGIFSLCYVYAT